MARMIIIAKVVMTIALVLAGYWLRGAHWSLSQRLSRGGDFLYLAGFVAGALSPSAICLAIALGAYFIIRAG